MTTTIPRKPAVTLTSHDGRPVDLVTKAFLVECGKVTDYPWSVTQGYNPGGVAASAQTHHFGVVDLPSWDWKRKLKVWCAMGGWGYLRTSDEGPWPEHLHCGINNHPGMHDQAKAQQDDFWADPPRSGLSGHAIDRSVLEYRGKFRVFDYREAIEPKPTPIQVARGELVHAIHDAKAAIAALRDADGRPVAQAQRDEIRRGMQEFQRVLERMPKK
jgi:hypothetical protein